MAELWEYPGKAAWYFLSVPHEIADDISERALKVERGFGSVPVNAVIGSSRWRTSLFPDRKQASFILPVKKSVRMAEGLKAGSMVKAGLSLRR